MKHTWLVAVAVLLSVSVATAQEVPQAPQTQNQQPVMGRGRGGAPFAWNDQNRDGVCDLTGRAVGERPIGFGRGRGWRVMADPPAGQATGQGQGLGRGGAARAWNDRNGDGLCDLTGKPVGRAGAGAGWGRGGGRGASWR